ncbi:DgyrCDS7160 [Dimorphilus gyrociliatus]|uniref:DgyrCDS7160 n=1 Tax=Dimorphilus gyrociliatus TaxID=2664684 RepID=A0A7I8VQ95_9ANNE|nr:DgyrCDS7160 [Dimorphilus gyrociliatus]
MDANIKIKSRLFNTLAVEQREELDERLERCNNALQVHMDGVTERESNEALNSQVCKGPTQHEEIQLGLLYSILTDKSLAAKCHRNMTLINRDGFSVVVNTMGKLIHEKWPKMLDGAKTQYLWLCRELLKSNVNNLDTVITGCLKQIAGGDISQKNIFLAETVLDILTENRIIADHCRSELNHLRQKEVEFCVNILRERWQDCMTIGRDLVRLLQNVSRIPEFTSICYDMMYNPTALSPTFTGIDQIMKMKSSRTYIRSRLTPDMEFKLHFLTTKVAFGNHKRYQDWFQRQYLSTPESQTLRCDIIRYICTVVHPSSDILAANITPRWVVIGWLLVSCSSNLSACDAKLSLFFDWLFFDPDKDSILNLEPAILVMLNSMRSRPTITVNLLDFLCRIMKNFCLPFASEVKQSIHGCLKALLNKKFVSSLEPLFENPSHDKDLKAIIKECFTEFLTQPETIAPPPPTSKLPLVIDLESESTNNSVIEIEGQFSDCEENADEETGVKIEKIMKAIELKPITERLRRKNGAKGENILKLVEKLDGDIKTFIKEMEQESDSAVQCETMDKLMQAVMDEGLDNESATALAISITSVIDYCFQCQILPGEQTEESLEDSLGTPLFVIFRNLCAIEDDDPRKQTLLVLLQEMYKVENRVGHRFLYFLKVRRLFPLPLQFTDDFNNCDLVRLIVSVLDGPLLNQLLCHKFQGKLDMFEDKYLPVIESSLKWESIEQYYLWQLLVAHSMPIENILPLLPKLQFIQHADTLQNIILLLREKSPNGQLLQAILHRKVEESDILSVSVLKYWADKEEEKLADNFYSLLTKASSKKRNRGGTSVKSKDKDKSTLSIDQILSHLEHYRHTVTDSSFLLSETMQSALQSVQQSSSEAVKSKFSDLLALVEEERPTRVRVLRDRKGASNNNSRANLKRKEASPSSEESTDEDDRPPKTKKKRRNVSDSD